MSTLKVLYAKLSKINFRILSTHAQGHIYHKPSVVTFPIREWNFPCCSTWETFGLLFAAIKYSSNDLPVFCNIYSTPWRIPKIHTNGNSDSSGLKRSFCFVLLHGYPSAEGTHCCMSSASYWTSGLHTHAPILTLIYWRMVAASVRKASPTHFKWSSYHLCYTSVRLGLCWGNWVNSAFKGCTLMPTNFKYIAQCFC